MPFAWAFDSASRTSLARYVMSILATEACISVNAAVEAGESRPRSGRDGASGTPSDQARWPYRGSDPMGGMGRKPGLRFFKQSKSKIMDLKRGRRPDIRILTSHSRTPELKPNASSSDLGHSGMGWWSVPQYSEYRTIVQRKRDAQHSNRDITEMGLRCECD